MSTYHPDDVALIDVTPIDTPPIAEEKDMGALKPGTTIEVPNLAGKWSVWSASNESPGAYFVVPSDDEAREIKVKFAVIKATLKRGEPWPEFRLLRIER